MEGQIIGRHCKLITICARSRLQTLRWLSLQLKGSADFSAAENVHTINQRLKRGRLPFLCLLELTSNSGRAWKNR